MRRFFYFAYCGFLSALNVISVWPFHILYIEPYDYRYLSFQYTCGAALLSWSCMLVRLTGWDYAFSSRHCWCFVAENYV